MTCTCSAPAQQRPGALVDGGARRVDVVDERERARPRAGCERAAHVAPACERIQAALAAVRPACGARAARPAGPDQRPSSPASSVGGSAPRCKRRSRTAGTTASASTLGRCSSWATNAPASRTGEISPRFQRATTSSTGPSSQSAERAVVNQRSRAHARQVLTVRAVGAPQRSHDGAARARTRWPQSSHIHSPGRRHAAQRRGSTRRRSEVGLDMRPG